MTIPLSGVKILKSYDINYVWTSFALSMKLTVFNINVDYWLKKGQFTDLNDKTTILELTQVCAIFLKQNPVFQISRA